MPTDLPTAIREALHADEIGPADLHQPMLRERSRTRRAPRILAMSASAAAVAALAVVLAVTVPGHSGGQQPAAGGGALAGVAGYRWDVTAVRDGQGALAVPASLGAEIGFTRGGYVLGDDSVNALSGRYHETADGYRVSDAGTTLALGGDDSTRRRVIDAIDGMFYTVSDSADAPPPVVVAVRLDGHTLTLRHGATTLTLTRAGAQPEALIATPSGTATRSAAAMGTVSGRLLVVGGAPVLDGSSPTPGPLSGTVTITGPALDQPHTITVGADGAYTLAVPAGTYRLVGGSQRYNGNTVPCRAGGPVHVTAGATVQADVICAEK